MFILPFLHITVSMPMIMQAVFMCLFAVPFAFLSTCWHHCGTVEMSRCSETSSDHEISIILFFRPKVPRFSPLLLECITYYILCRFSVQSLEFMYQHPEISARTPEILSFVLADSSVSCGVIVERERRVPVHISRCCHMNSRHEQ